MKKIISFIFVLSTLMFLTPDRNAHAQEHGGMEEISSVHNYIEYLSKKSENDESAKEVLDQFLELSKEDQKLFVQALEPQNYLRLINAGQNNPDKNIAVELDNGQKINMQLNLITEQDTFTPFIPYATTWKVTTPWAKVDMVILGITTSTFQTRMILQTDGVHALQVYDIEKKYVNHNPGVWTTDVGYTNFYVSSGYGHGGYQWKLSSTGTLGGLSSNLDMIIKANHTKQYFKVDSGRDSWAIGWTQF
ncbi:hypothetical protein J2D69_02830 [Lysinibacillus sphaericus]|uniref:Uncharacterized protein n=3 Tax=Lysinibacillus TaxID=400634 RepID=B1HMC2_LYSSC|nr:MULTISPECIES: hypothetical protein [Lysinibacillus]MBE5082091.1 hypothetical protein [Bacillus thuringiensis]ACA38694.1 hypothetical protein Bsph_1084 [Lysinibacillus sphaericus C3-41]AMO31049.1 hypothetical protein AR327_00145 [Lysinibacillus sphaericus]AMR89844.1 hypothetical protein A1T07_06530 [Lysinibacillus sphaericus]ANA47915.1 hypothetical protein A2J09_21735 [Lysinibacillus sphaericus]